ncbi:hypothetical protein C8J57DRAFT_1664792 [Mycena rebaudengoi]|nr:hypothetical protein C8J57DRAFT_1664792 [Mycena rebaudengoi]
MHPVDETGPQGQETRSTRSAARARIWELDARILELERALAAARLERQELFETHLIPYKYPILTLPSEITSEIFLHFIPVYPNRPDPRGIESPTRLGQICRTWREIAFRTPRLWRAIKLDLYQTPSTRILQLDILSTWLLRSKNSPLSISMKYPLSYSEADLPQFAVEITRHSSRWEYVELLLPSDNLRLIGSADFPLLRSLAFGAGGYFHEPGSLDNVSSFANAPNLTDVTLFKGCSPFRTALPWSQLTRLSADMLFTHECAEILQHASALVDFSTNMCGNDDEGELAPFKPLKHLQSLRLGDLKSSPCPIQRRILDALTAPALRHLQISEQLSVAGGHILATVAALISRSRCTLVSLQVFHARLPEATYHAAFPSIPTITLLSRAV